MRKLKLPYLNICSARGYQFYQIPKAIVHDKMFSGLDGNAKILYSLMLNRSGLSIKSSKENSSFTDKNGNVYIIFPLDEIMEYVQCGKNSAIKYLKQLDNIGLIERKKRGQGYADIIYVKDFNYFDQSENDEKSQISKGLKSKPLKAEVYKINFQKSIKQTSRGLKSKLQDVYNANLSIPINKSDPKKTNFSENDINNRSIDQSKNSPRARARDRPIDRPTDKKSKIPIEDLKNIVRKQLWFDALLEKYPMSKDKKNLQAVYDLIVETYLSGKSEFKVNKQAVSAKEIQYAFYKLKPDHVLYVVESIKTNPETIRNMKAFCMTALYNASVDNLTSPEINISNGSLFSVSEYMENLKKYRHEK